MYIQELIVSEIPPEKHQTFDMCKMYKEGIKAESVQTKHPFYKLCNYMFIILIKY